MSGFLFTVAVLFVVLGVLIFVHEFGHYWAAKRFGVWVHRFSIGMGKPVKALSFQRGETEWAISWLPLGGYVKMASSEEEPASSVLEGGHSADVPADRVFEAKPIWQRMVIILAGVTLNALFAWVVFTGLAWKNGRQFDPTTRIGRINTELLPPEAAELATIPVGTKITAIDGEPVHSWDDIRERVATGNSNEIGISFEGHAPIVIKLHRDALAERGKTAVALEPQHPAVLGDLTPNYPAAKAGLQAGDSVVAINGQPVTQWVDAVALIKQSGGVEARFDVIRNGAPVSVTVTPKLEREIAADTTSKMIGRIGAMPRQPIETESLGLVGAVRVGTELTVSSAGAIFRTFRGLATRKVATTEIGGPIMIGQMAAQQARAGIEPLLAFMALISMNLAVVNLLPIPVLDGGAFLILLAEGAMRRPLPPKVREMISLAGLGMILLIMFVAFKNDIMRLLGQ